jgi:hypothetical protein
MKTLGRLWENIGKTLRRLWEDFMKTLGRLWENFGKTLGRLWEDKIKILTIGCEAREPGTGGVGLKLPGILEENLWNLGKDFWGIPWDSCIGCGCLPDEIRKFGAAEIRMKFKNKINFESGVEIRMKILGIVWVGDPDEILYKVLV